MPTGPSTSQTPYLLGLEPNVKFTSILSTGDQIGNSGLVFGGIPDGVGAHDNGDGTVSLFVNHELVSSQGTTRAHGGIGAYVDEVIVNKSTLAVTGGGDLIKEVFLYNTATQSYDLTANVNFSRFCSSDLPDQKALFNSLTGNGSQELIYFTGEEDGSTGRAVAIIASGANKGQAYELASLGNAAWENVVASAGSGDKTVLIADQDGGTGHVFVYVGDKKNTGTDIEKAGLTGGALYGIKVSGLVDENNNTSFAPGTDFSLALVSADATGLNAAQTDAAAETAGATSFLRPEDGAFDPINPNRYYFVTTNNISGPSRLFALDFTDIKDPTLGGKITILLDGSEGVSPEGVHRMFDNITFDKRTGHVILQEDPGNQARVAQVWDYDPVTDKLVSIAQHDPARFKAPFTTPFTQDEESSGVVDVTSIFGNGHNSAFILDVQAHYNAATDPYLNGTTTGVNVAPTVVEGGQLLLLTVEDVVTQGKNNVDDVLLGSAADETFNGLSGDDTIRAGSGIDTLNGGAGNDTLDGGNGEDLLNGGVGDDTLIGGAGNDIVNGNAGDDTLIGGTGQDTLFSGAGSDTFVFNAVLDSPTRAGSEDLIKDFRHGVEGSGDILDLSGIDANTTTAGDQAFALVSSFHRVAGELVIQKVSGQYNVLGDVDGDGLVDFTLHVNSVTGIFAEDIIF